MKPPGRMIHALSDSCLSRAACASAVLFICASRRAACTHGRFCVHASAQPHRNIVWLANQGQGAHLQVCISIAFSQSLDLKYITLQALHIPIHALHRCKSALFVLQLMSAFLSVQKPLYHESGALACIQAARIA